jgi:hypothetical protein
MESRRAWVAVILPIGHAEVFGSMWVSDRLHWTCAEAVSEIEEHVIRRGLLPMEWTRPEGDLLIGRTRHPGNDQLGSRFWFAVPDYRKASHPQNQVSKDLGTVE